MNKADDKLKFVELRAQGQPYSKIAKRLKVSKGTLTAWNNELKEQIAEQRSERLRELYDSYFMLKESRIKQLGDTLKSVNDALEKKDLALLPIDKLIEFKIKLIEGLKEEYIELDTETTAKLNAETILEELLNLLRRLREGDTNINMASRETIILVNAMKAYENITIEQKLAKIEAMLEGRKQ
jgi:transcriptional regulator